MSALVRRVSVDGGEPETLSAPARLFRTVFYLQDGRLAWTVVEPGRTLRTRIEVRDPDGTVSALRSLRGYTDRVAASPTGDGLYGRHRRTAVSGRSETKELVFIPLSDGAPRRVISLSDRMYWEPQFAVATDNKSLFLGEQGQLWRIRLPGGTREPIAFRPRVRLEVRNPAPPPTWAPAALGTTVPPRSVLWPRLSPDGRTLVLVFVAVHHLWQRSLDGGEPERLLTGGGLEWAPAYSPAGRQLAFVHRQIAGDHVKILDIDSRQTRTVASARGLSASSWSPDGRGLVFVEQEDSGRSRIVVVNLDDGHRTVLAASARSGARPHFSADGE